MKEISSIQVLKANYFGWCRGENAWLAHVWWCQAWGWRQVGDGGIGIGILIIINLLYDYISPTSRSAFFNLSFVWKEGLHDQVPVIATVQLQTPLCFLLSCGRAFGSVAKRYNLSLSTRSKLTK